MLLYKSLYYPLIISMQGLIEIHDQILLGINTIIKINPLSEVHNNFILSLINRPMISAIKTALRYIRPV